MAILSPDELRAHLRTQPRRTLREMLESADQSREAAENSVIARREMLPEAIRNRMREEFASAKKQREARQ